MAKDKTTKADDFDGVDEPTLVSSTDPRPALREKVAAVRSKVVVHHLPEKVGGLFNEILNLFDEILK